MSISKRINKLMEKQGLSRYKLAKLSKVPYTTLIKVLDGTTKNPQIETLSAVAEVLGVKVDDLSEPWIEELIEEGLDQTGITLKELSERANIPLEKLQNIGNMTPNPWDYEDGGLIDRLAKALNMNFKELASAYARQEPPAYEGPTSTVEEDFSNIDFSNVVDEKQLREEVKTLERADEILKPAGTSIADVVERELTEEQILTLAAHQVGHEGRLTEEQLAQIKLALKIALVKDKN